MIDVVCVLHGGFTVPEWLTTEGHRLHVTVNDPADHPYAQLPLGAHVTRNAAPCGFAENVNAALRTLFARDRVGLVCVVNFDVEGPSGAVSNLASALSTHGQWGAVGAALSTPRGPPALSAGTVPTPLKEFLRAAGLRGAAGVRLQRSLLRLSSRWTARNARPTAGPRGLGPREYLPWTFVVIRQECWEAVGELDERFPLYAEDIDWSLRCQAAGWRLGLVDCGSIVHAERATRSPHTDALYEFSHLELHRKWGWDANLRWQQRGLGLRRRWPIRRLTAPLDWSVLG